MNRAIKCSRSQLRNSVKSGDHDEQGVSDGVVRVAYTRDTTPRARDSRRHARRVADGKTATGETSTQRSSTCRRWTGRLASHKALAGRGDCLR